jgi:hypothetical protein
VPVPPPWLARLAVRARNLLGRGHARTAPPFLLVLERLFGLIDNKALAVAVELGVPEALAAGPRRADALARAVGADPDALDRLLRYLVSRDLLGVTKDGRYRATAATDLLRADHPWSFRDWVLFLGGDWHWRIWNRATHAVRTGESAAVAATGHAFFDYVNAVDPAAGAAFNGAMAIGSRMQGLLVLEAYDFAGVRRLCDVGGGTGAILADVLATYPRMRGVLFDLPALEGAARALLARRGVADRAEYVGGDFFAAVPEGCDLYTLYAIIHDWDDAACVRILANIARAMPPRARLLVIEAPLPTDTGASPTKAFDLEMLILTGAGRERTTAEYERLFRRAGLRLRRTIPLPSLFRIFELTATGATT